MQYLFFLCVFGAILIEVFDGVGAVVEYGVGDYAEVFAFGFAGEVSGEINSVVVAFIVVVEGEYLVGGEWVGCEDVDVVGFRVVDDFVVDVAGGLADDGVFFLVFAAFHVAFGGEDAFASGACFDFECAIFPCIAEALEIDAEHVLLVFTGEAVDDAVAVGYGCFFDFWLSFGFGLGIVVALDDVVGGIEGGDLVVVESFVHFFFIGLAISTSAEKYC